MPFPMIHLHVANKIATIHPELIKSPSQFYLGTLSPDSVHMREEFIANEKKITHLCTSDENWGEITKNDEWIDNVMSFWHEHKNSDNSCFVLGYCVHILSDIYGNIHIWTPFKQKMNLEMKDYYGGAHHNRQASVDFKLAHEFARKKEIWDLLKKSKVVTIPGIVFEGDIEKQKYRILYEQYEDITEDKRTIDETLYQNALTQIENTTNFVLQTLGDVDMSWHADFRV